MSLRYLCSNEIQGLTEDAQANAILQESGIDYDDVPIIIEHVATALGFCLAKVTRFKNPDSVAGVVHQEKINKVLKSNLYIVVKNDIDTIETRYLVALCLASYILESKNDYYLEEIFSDVLKGISDAKRERLARAILMPPKSLTTFIMSPMIQKLAPEDRVRNVAKAFLVPNYVAQARIQEMGF